MFDVWFEMLPDLSEIILNNDSTSNTKYNQCQLQIHFTLNVITSLVEFVNKEQMYIIQVSSTFNNFRDLKSTSYLSASIFSEIL